MMRRKLTAYTFMLIAGISAGYIILEKIRILPGILFIVCIGIAIFIVKTDGDTSVTFAERRKCFIIMLTGLLIFSANFACFEGITAEGDKVYIHGKVLTAEDKNDYIRLVVKDEKSGYRISANVAAYGDVESDIANYIGSTASLTGEVRHMSEADNPGCFDYRLYMRSKGIAFSVKSYSLELNDDNIPKAWTVRRYLIKERERFLSYFDDEVSGFLRGVIFGDKSELNEDVLREFNLNSSGHILAVSGLHIGFLHSLLKMLSGRKKTLPVSILIISIMAVYGEMTMWSSSTIRALIMLSLSIISVNLHRAFDLLSSIATSALIILIVRPYMLFNAGFQLSFAAMSGIAFLSGYIIPYLGEVLGTAASVQIGTMPIIALNFHRINLLSVLINIPIIMLSSILVPVCIFILMISMITGNIPVIFTSAISFICDGLISFNHILAFGGDYSNLSSGLGSALTISFYILLFFCSSEWMRVQITRKNLLLIKRALLFLALPMLLIHVCLWDSFADDEMVFVSVGQGDCTHIRCNDKEILIDGGGSDRVNTGERTLMPYLFSQGVKDVDIAMVTHLHMDHYLGISELSNIYPVRCVAIPIDYKNSYESGYSADGLARFESENIIYLDKSTRLTVDDDVFIEVLWPLASEAGGISMDDPNEHNMVYMIHYYGRKIMITGDLLEEDELKMVDHYKGSDALKCDILKVAHHGSKSSSSEVFLDAASPEIAVIQVGKNNIYGHPHAQTIERLELRNINTYRNDTSGAIGVDIDRRGGRIRVHTMH